MIRSITAVIVAAILGFGAGPAVAATHAPPVPDGAPRTRSSSDSGSGVLGPYAGTPSSPSTRAARAAPGAGSPSSETPSRSGRSIRLCADSRRWVPTCVRTLRRPVPPRRPSTRCSSRRWSTRMCGLSQPARTTSSTLRRFPAQVARVLHAAQGRPVVWVNVFVHRWRVSAAMRVADLRNSRRLNAVLARAASHIRT